MFQGGVYGSTHWGAAYLSGALSYSWHDVTTDRTVSVAGTDNLTAASRARCPPASRPATACLGGFAA